MDELEARLRAAMKAAAEPPPSGLMDAIRRRHRRHLMRVGAGCVVIVAATAVISPAVLHALLAASPAPGRMTTAPAATPAQSPSAEPGTFLLTCNSANWGRLPSNWRTASLNVGPLWFVDGLRYGYVHDASPGASIPSTQGRSALRDGVMIVEVADGSTVVMKAAPSAQSYFRFVDGYNGIVPNSLPSGDSGFTFRSCPFGTPGPNGRVTDFYLGFQIEAGHAAPVDVWTSPAARPIRVIFNCPGSGCQG